ncbi:MAG: excisionase family DNA-binding protein [Candidatus Omnitrophota bacterium]
MADQFISVREAAQALGTSEKIIMDLVEDRKLQAYRIAGQFLRLKRSEVLDLKNTGDVTEETIQFKYTSSERFKDFFYFNDFYILSALIIVFLLYVIFYI